MHDAARAPRVGKAASLGHTPGMLRTWLLLGWTFAVLSATASLPTARAEAVAVNSAPRASSPELEPAQSKPWLKPGVLAAGLAVFPGFLLHGSGTFAIGQRQTARKLVLSEAAGLTAFLSAGTLIAVTGTSRRLIGVLAPVTLAGFGIFVLGFLADVYAASSGGRDAHAPLFVPQVDSELGYLHVYDPQFAYRSFLHARADLRAGAFRASPQAWIAVDEDNQRLSLEVAYRALGRTPRRAAADGSFLELGTGVRYHRFAREDFAVITPEWQATGRLDLVRLGPSLSGSFVEGLLGAGLELYDFQVPGSSIANNAFGLLLARFGFGLYFGDGGANSGEAAVYYDHRHDDFAAGLGVQGIPAGILGHLGARGHYYITQAWGVSGLVELGSAVVTGLSLRYRHVARPISLIGGAP
jgi:hypothetical protein